MNIWWEQIFKECSKLTVIWGGLNTDEPHCGDVMLKILLNAGNSFEVAYVWFLIILITFVKIAMNAFGSRKSAGVSNSKELLASQRLHAGDLVYAYLVGFMEGDGYFTVTTNGLYVKYELGIELSIKDVKLIYKIKKLFGVGIVSFITRKDGTETVSLRIRNKDHLKNFIIPIFDKYPMFSNKQYDYLRFKDALLSGIIYSDDLPLYSKSKYYKNSIESILSASYFSPWLVGFIEAEGCFSIYKLNKNYIIKLFAY